MVDLTSRLYTRAKRSYRRRRGYRRLATATNESRSRWPWMRIPRRLKIKLRFKFNPKKLVASVHGAYVRMMIRLANSSVVRGGALAGYGAGGGINQFGMRPMKEYDEKIIIQLYKSLSVRPEQPVALEDGRADPDNLFAVIR